jgi:putative transposase
MKAFKYKLRPSKSVAAKFQATRDVCRELYNASVQERRDSYRVTGKGVGFAAQSRQLPEIKSEREDVAAVFSQVLQDVLHRSDKAFAAFFRRVQAGEKPGYPRFQGKNRYASFTYPQAGFRLDADTLHLSKIGSVRLRLSRPVQGRIKTCTIKREADGWYVIFAVEQDRSPYYPRTGEDVGVDVGIESLATLSTGEVIENPRHLAKAEARLTTAQRKVSRRKRGSRRRHKDVRLLARQHHKVARQRADAHHKAALSLVRKFDRIAFEDLNISGLLKNHHLAKAISDVGWNQFIAITTSKAESAGRRVVLVPAQYTSQDCSGCGARVRKTLAVREHRCTACGLVLHRDHNAARNINGRAGRSRMDARASA